LQEKSTRRKDKKPKILSKQNTEREKTKDYLAKKNKTEHTPLFDMNKTDSIGWE